MVLMETIKIYIKIYTANMETVSDDTKNNRAAKIDKFTRFTGYFILIKPLYIFKFAQAY